jgi:uncharacterized membrane protein
MQTEKQPSHPGRWIIAVLGSALAAYGFKKVLHSVSKNGKRGEQVSVPYGKGVRVEKAVTINTTPSAIYAFWRDFENLPRFMRNLKSVECHDSQRSHWVAAGPAGMSAEWEAEIINDIPNELIAWRSVEGSKVDNAGSVHFNALDGRGTEVKVVLRYDPPAGLLGAAVTKLFGEDPAMQVQEDLRRLKMLIETGEIATTEGQPSGRKIA